MAERECAPRRTGLFGGGVRGVRRRQHCHGAAHHRQPSGTSSNRCSLRRASTSSLFSSPFLFSLFPLPETRTICRAARSRGARARIRTRWTGGRRATTKVEKDGDVAGGRTDEGERRARSSTERVSRAAVRVIADEWCCRESWNRRRGEERSSRVSLSVSTSKLGATKRSKISRGVGSIASSVIASWRGERGREFGEEGSERMLEIGGGQRRGESMVRERS